MKPKIEEAISLPVLGELRGFRYKGETELDAAARCIKEVYERGNMGLVHLHLELKPEWDIEPGQSRFATSISKALLDSSLNCGELQASVSEMTAIIDEYLNPIRNAFRDMVPCPIITHHPKGPCAFCVAWAMRDILTLKVAP